jgi:hypothetical protein
MTHLTTDKHISNLSSMIVVDPDGVRHYAIIVDELPKFDRFRNMKLELPFFVKMCDLCDAYDDATGWVDFWYPDVKYTRDEVIEGYPTCARCSGV